jgi:redox-sensitive bicupin YhaK (pirin superfamily)
MSPLRPILGSSTGHWSGPINRLVDPGGLGQALKPFVFLDHFNAEVKSGFGFGMHPHSGIATLTWQPMSDVQYEDTTGQRGVLPAGGLEWMNAGGGAWHQGHLLATGRVRGFQLWVAMPPGVEDGPAQGHYVAPEEVPVLRLPGGQVKVLLGELPGPAGARQPLQCPIQTHQDMNYLVLSLEAGQSWLYEPPPSHTVAWAFGFEGQATVQGQVADQTLLHLGASGGVEVQAGEQGAQVLLGSAAPHPHPLVMGPSSIHTRPESLQQGLERIQALGRALHRQGRL